MTDLEKDWAWSINRTYWQGVGLAGLAYSYVYVVSSQDMKVGEVNRLLDGFWFPARYEHLHRYMKF